MPNQYVTPDVDYRRAVIKCRICGRKSNRPASVFDRPVCLDCYTEAVATLNRYIDGEQTAQAALLKAMAIVIGGEVKPPMIILEGDNQ